MMQGLSTVSLDYLNLLSIVGLGGVLEQGIGLRLDNNHLADNSFYKINLVFDFTSAKKAILRNKSCF